MLEKSGTENNVFKRTLNTVPSIDADCFLLQGNELSTFMNIISTNSDNPLTIGKYTISEESNANLDGNKFFQRHAVIVGGTGSGKSYTVANILEKASKLKSVNCIVFDLHGEYKPLKDLENSILLKVAGPSDSPTGENIIFLPYWLLSYEEIESLLLDRSDSNAPNQSRTLFDLIINFKRALLEKENKQDVLDNFTVESPIPYKISDVLLALEEKGLQSFERIAKEGRKYGVSLVVISQRPSDVNKTILSQCGNFIAMRLTNPDDQNVIKRFFPDNLGDFSELLPILDVGESLIVGDASLLPSRVIIDKPSIPPSSATVDFWNEWDKEKTEKGIEEAVESLRKQQK